MDLGLKGKIALVTGASRGLGYATALQLGFEGARLAINSRNSENINAASEIISTSTGAEVYPVAGNIADPDFPETLIARTIEHYGSLDILVANAGGPPSGKFESFPDKVWYEAIEQNLLGTVRLIRAAIPYLRLSEFPSILTITSYSAKQPIPNLVLSNTIRAAVLGLTKTLALELGTDKIRVNSILPGWTETERVTELMDARSKINNTSIDLEIQKQAKESPFGRMATPEEFAKPATFLVSPAASYITGVMLTVDGGMYKSTI
ncbi:MAG: SDR family oxidoreductase [Anaerolineaceae bacterium]|nr:SDR family oxidoreductase [Anaerolineaceae bacterium]